MGRNTAGSLGSVLALAGCESHSTLSLYLNNGEERHYSTANEDLAIGGKTFVPGLVMASELAQVIGTQPSRVPLSIGNVDGAMGTDVRAEYLVRAKAAVGHFLRTAGGLTAWSEKFSGEAIVSNTL